MSTESMVTQADFEAIMDRLEKGPMNLTGKSWRDTPDDPSAAELREHFILPVIEEYVARRTAAQPEREAVDVDAICDEAVRLANESETGRKLWQAAYHACMGTRAALTTPAPAVSRDDLWNPPERAWNGLARQLVMWLDIGDKTPRALFKHLERSGHEIPQWLRDEPELQHLDHVPSKGTRAVIIYRAILSRIRGEGE